MANESNQVYSEYEDALNASKVQLKTVGSDGSSTYIDATYNNLVTTGYKLSSGSATLVSQTDIDYFNNTAEGNAAEFACLKSGYCQKSGSSIVLTSDTTKTCIFTADQLKAQTSSSSGKSYILMDDINVTSSMGAFAGTLDGNGNTINVSGDSPIFSSLDNATITNLNVASNIITSSTSSKVAALAGQSTGTTNISNVRESGSIQANNGSSMGTLVGLVTGGSTLNVSNCNSSIDLTGSLGTSAPDIGGLVGTSVGTLNVNNSSYTGDIDLNIANCPSGCNANVGGILGYSYGAGNFNITDTSVISNNINLTGGGVGAYNVGGIVGAYWWPTNSSTITNSSSYIDTISVNAPNSSIGGIAGSMATGTINGCYSNDILIDGNGTSSLGGTIGSPGSTAVTNSYTDSNSPSGALGDQNTTTTTATKSDIIASCPTSATGGTTTQTYDPSTAPGYDSYLEIGKAITSNTYFLIDGHENDTTWLTNMLDAGFVILSKKDSSTGDYLDTNVATDTNLQEVSDDKNLKKAEAKYESSMAKINNKDKKFDTDIAALDTERNAVKTEIDTLKTVSKDNIDRTFKLFS